MLDQAEEHVSLVANCRPSQSTELVHSRGQQHKQCRDLQRLLHCVAMKMLMVMLQYLIHNATGMHISRHQISFT